MCKVASSPAFFSRSTRAGSWRSTHSALAYNPRSRRTWRILCLSTSVTMVGPLAARQLDGNGRQRSDSTPQAGAGQDRRRCVRRETGRPPKRPLARLRGRPSQWPRPAAGHETAAAESGRQDPHRAIVAPASSGKATMAYPTVRNDNTNGGTTSSRNTPSSANSCRRDRTPANARSSISAPVTRRQPRVRGRRTAHPTRPRSRCARAAGSERR